jgi:hypothetical protein
MAFVVLAAVTISRRVVRHFGVDVMSVGIIAISATEGEEWLRTLQPESGVPDSSSITSG